MESPTPAFNDRFMSGYVPVGAPRAPVSVLGQPGALQRRLIKAAVMGVVVTGFATAFAGRGVLSRETLVTGAAAGLATWLADEIV